MARSCLGDRGIQRRGERRGVETGVGVETDVGLPAGELVDGAADDQATVVDHDGPVADAFDVVVAMGRDEHCGPRIGTSSDDVEHSASPSRVEGRGRLVEQEDVGTASECERQAEPLLFASGHPPPSASAELAEATRLQQLVGIGGGVVETHEQLDRLGDRQPHRQPASLGHHTPSSGEHGAVSDRVEAEDRHSTGRRRLVPLDRLDRRRLARAVRPQQTDDLAGLDPQAQPVDHSLTVDLSDEVEHLDRSLGRHRFEANPSSTAPTRPPPSGDHARPARLRETDPPDLVLEILRATARVLETIRGVLGAVRIQNGIGGAHSLQNREGWRGVSPEGERVGGAVCLQNGDNGRVTNGDDLARMRLDYSQQGLDERDASEDAMEQFDRWLADAVAAGVHEPNAMVVSTVDAAGSPWARHLLLKGMSDDEDGLRGFEFYTNYTSAKAGQLAANPNVALTFPWIQLERQVCITGKAERVSDAESDAYFSVRPRGSQLGAWTSEQSSEIADRSVLEARQAEFEARFPDEVPRPPHWGGYRVTPAVIEFWQGRPSRLHDRLRYERSRTGGWARSRLAP